MQSPSFFELEVHIPNTDYSFSIEKDSKHSHYFVLSPRQIAGRRGCVVISFDPLPDADADEENKFATLQSIYYEDKCAGKKMLRPLDPKKGTRSMILGALHAFKYLAHTKNMWPHLTTFILTDESTYKCAHSFKKIEIETFATDLLTGDQTYYERHLNAKLVSNVARISKAGLRQRMMTIVDVNGIIFWKEIEKISIEEVLLTNKQKRWMQTFSKDIIELLDEMKLLKRTWQEFFLECRDICGCDFYACCSRQIVRYFAIEKLRGAAYVVKMDELPGSHLKNTMVKDVIKVNLHLRGGKGEDDSLTFLHGLFVRALSAMHKRKTT